VLVEFLDNLPGRHLGHSIVLLEKFLGLQTQEDKAPGTVSPEWLTPTHFGAISSSSMVSSQLV
jgi:hypothetical protein